QRAQRGNAHSGADQRDAIIGARMAGERSVGPLDGDAGTRPEPTHRAALVAEPLDGHTDIGRLWQRGQRVRVRLPPQVPGEEAPEEELASRNRQAIQPPTLADDRDHAWRLFADLDDPKPVPQAPPDRLSHP